jgi:hypothetical protein
MPAIEPEMAYIRSRSRGKLHIPAPRKALLRLRSLWAFEWNVDDKFPTLLEYGYEIIRALNETLLRNKKN